VKPNSDFDRFLPLPPAALHILLALTGEERHGYGIMQDIARQSEGRYKLGPGTLYDNLQKLMKDRLVEESENNSTGAEARRRYYRLTKLGRRVISAEIVRLEEAIREAKVHLGFKRSAT
jgi:DNA-binding PadR family transcriptional regulator